MNWTLSERIVTVRLRIITVQIVRDRWTSDLIAIVGLRSNEQIKSKHLLFINARSTPDPSSSIKRPTNDHDDSQKDARSRSSIAMNLNLTAENQIRFYKNEFSRRRTCSRLSIKFSLFNPSFRVPFVRECSWLISASIECLKSNFDRKRRKKSHLELQFLSSSIRNEKPCIRQLIGSFRRLLWVRLRDFILIFHHLVLILLLAS